MTEKDYNPPTASSHSRSEWAPLIGKIRELRQIKPRKDWVVLTKKEILGEEPEVKWSTILETLPRLIFGQKFALAGVVSFVILFGLFLSAQSSLPGDLLYPIKKITEKSRAVFVSEEEKPTVQLELANKRLEELTKIAEQNQVKKLAPAIEEYQKSVTQAAKSLKKVTQKVIQETKKLEENKEKIESLGIVIEETEKSEFTISNRITYAKIMEVWIKDLEGSTLNDVQQKTFEEAKQAFEDGSYEKVQELVQLLPSQR